MALLGMAVCSHFNQRFRFGGDCIFRRMITCLIGMVMHTPTFEQELRTFEAERDDTVRMFRPAVLQHESGPHYLNVHWLIDRESRHLEGSGRGMAKDAFVHNTVWDDDDTVKDDLFGFETAWIRTEYENNPKQFQVDYLARIKKERGRGVERNKQNNAYIGLSLFVYNVEKYVEVSKPGYSVFLGENIDNLQEAVVVVDDQSGDENEDQLDRQLGKELMQNSQRSTNEVFGEMGTFPFITWIINDDMLFAGWPAHRSSNSSYVVTEDINKLLADCGAKKHSYSHSGLAVIFFPMDPSFHVNNPALLKRIKNIPIVLSSGSPHKVLYCFVYFENVG